jgi:REP element-mobilizing transposase RayT
MLDEYDENVFPLAYLITFRTYGSWLHGDERSSTRRHRKSEHGMKRIDVNMPLKEKMRELMTAQEVVLDVRQRKCVEDAIRQVCKHRGYRLDAVNARSNHVHSVVAAQARPERIADALKAYSTRRLRELGLVQADQQVWSRGRSRRHLWKPRHVDAAIDYVLYCQEDVPFEVED